MNRKQFDELLSELKTHIQHTYLHADKKTVITNVYDDNTRNGLIVITIRGKKDD